MPKRIIAVAFVALPVVFGLARAIQTGRDVRYLLTALVSLAVTLVVFRFTASRLPTPLQRASVAFVAATLVGGIVAFALGARSGGAIVFVAAGFSLCTTTSGLLGLFETKRAP